MRGKVVFVAEQLAERQFCLEAGYRVARTGQAGDLGRLLRPIEMVPFQLAVLEQLSAAWMLAAATATLGLARDNGAVPLDEAAVVLVMPLRILGVPAAITRTVASKATPGAARPAAAVSTPDLYPVAAPRTDRGSRNGRRLVGL